MYIHIQTALAEITSVIAPMDSSHMGKADGILAFIPKKSLTAPLHYRFTLSASLPTFVTRVLIIAAMINSM